MVKLYILELYVKCQEDEIAALNDALQEAAVRLGLEITTIRQEVSDDDQD